jgi:hypothetical protein
VRGGRTSVDRRRSWEVEEEFEAYRRCIEKAVESCGAQGQVYLAGRQ